MRICLISSEFPPETGGGGVGRYMHDLTVELAVRGHDVTVVSVTDGALERWEQVEGARVLRLPRPSRSKVRVLKLLFGRSGGAQACARALLVRRAIARLEAAEGAFDVIEAALWDAEAAFLRRRNNLRLVTRLVTPSFRAFRAMGRQAPRALIALERRQLRHSARIVAISRAVGEDVAAYYELDSAEITLAPLGIPLPEDQPTEKGGHGIDLLFVGRLEQRKGVDELVQALPRVLAGHAGCRVHLVGRDIAQSPVGPYAAYIDVVVPHEDRDRVVLHGFVDDRQLDTMYRQCDVFVAPSRYESFGLIFLEAMARSKPVVGTTAGGIPEVVRDCGILVPPQDADALAEALIRLVADRGLRQRLGAAGRRLVESEFTVQAMADRTLEIYIDVARRASAAGRSRITSDSGRR